MTARKAKARASGAKRGRVRASVRAVFFFGNGQAHGRGEM
jgi:hypothetical protein